MGELYVEGLASHDGPESDAQASVRAQAKR